MPFVFVILRQDCSNKKKKRFPRFLNLQYSSNALPSITVSVRSTFVNRHKKNAVYFKSFVPSTHSETVPSPFSSSHVGYIQLTLILISAAYMFQLPVAPRVCMYVCVCIYIY
jgi:hypothetical protein